MTIRSQPARSLRALGLGFVLALGAVLAQSFVAPLPGLACSCVAPLPSLAEVAREENTVIVVGTIGQQLPDRTPVAVDTWFHGPGATDVVWLGFGSQSMSSCDPFVSPGERRLLVLFRQEQGGTHGYNPCVASGVIGTEAGDEALAQAVELFGAAPTPPEPPEPPEATEPPEPTQPPLSPRPTPGDPGAGWLFVAGTLAATALIFAVVAIAGLRRRRPR
ncbi:MAG TPA: hypothetical protein VM305_01110 [Candidatus Limnocylindrales bacterium]|nr:hypothetical protein [Candidatus Limnocylindrales bacterium]